MGTVEKVFADPDHAVDLGDDEASEGLNSLLNQSSVGGVAYRLIWRGPSKIPRGMKSLGGKSVGLRMEL